tara:strand:- start:612 stop:812 length:201 start_codon:yes stop_codon:yes gene_type:complete
MKQLNVLISEELQEALKEYCESNSVSMAMGVREAIMAMIKTPRINRIDDLDYRVGKLEAKFRAINI